MRQFAIARRVNDVQPGANHGDSQRENRYGGESRRGGYRQRLARRSRRDQGCMPVRFDAREGF